MALKHIKNAQIHSILEIYNLNNTDMSLLTCHFGEN